MKKLVYSLALATILMVVNLKVVAQIGVNTDGSQPDSSAMLDVKAINKGFLPPRVSLTAINTAYPISNPAIGLLVYNTATNGAPPNDVTAGFYYWNGTRWVRIGSANGDNIGDMLYWNGVQWVNVPVGINGQTLTLANGIPTWGGNQLPSVVTDAVKSYSSTTAVCAGNIILDGGSEILSRGVCWSKTANPTISDSHTADGVGIGIFYSEITGLNSNTVYHVRAYATSAVGLSYGNDVVFTTLPSCGTFTINHLAGSVSPVNKTVSYNTVRGLPGGATKCWITSNLGSDHQAVSVNDATEASAGWYWQFNRKQGYKHDGVSPTPSFPVVSPTENSDWVSGNDPCSIELGTDWRIPSYTEYYNVDNSGGWNDWNGPWNSGLKMHAAGCLLPNTGQLYIRGIEGCWWSSTQLTAGNGRLFSMGSDFSSIEQNGKGVGFSLRCLRDNCPSPTSPSPATHTPTSNQIIWNWNPVNGANGYKWNTVDDYSTATEMGAATTKFESGLNCNTPYVRYVWAYNSCGSSTATSLSQSTIGTDQVSVLISASNNPVCSSTLVSFTATPTNGGSAPSYQWKINSNSISGATTSSYSYTPANNDSVTCILTSNDACAMGNPATSNIIKMVVNQSLNPNVIIAASSNPVCTGVSVLFTSSILNGGTSPGYQWRKNGINITGATNGTYSYIPENGDSITCQLTSNIVCPQTNPVISNSIVMVGATIPIVPTQSAHTSLATQITWNWNQVNGAIGYKWDTVNDVANALDLGVATTKTETGLTCNTPYTRYAWAYNTCGNSTPVTLTQTTLDCSVFTCGQTITIIHVAGTVAPVNKTTSYGTVTNIPGEPTKCWITSNLGSDHQATAYNDVTEPSAGWYWQFNRKQGYKHDGTTVTPAWTITGINESSNWIGANDPCSLELGIGWRIPTQTEWQNVDNAGGWTSPASPWNSNLKMHYAGVIAAINGSLYNRGSYCEEWSSTQNGSSFGKGMVAGGTACEVNCCLEKASGLTIRCLKAN